MAVRRGRRYSARPDHRDIYLEQQQTEKIETEVKNVDRIRITGCTLAVQGGLLGGHKSAPVRHKHMLSPLLSAPH